MDEKNVKWGSIVGLLTVILTQFFLKALGVSTLSTIIYITFILVLGVTFAVYMFISKNKKLGRKISIVAGLLMLAMSICNAAAMLLIRCYPDFGDNHKIAAMVIIFSAVITFFVVIVFWAVIGTKLSKKYQK